MTNNKNQAINNKVSQNTGTQMRASDNKEEQISDDTWSLLCNDSSTCNSDSPSKVFYSVNSSFDDGTSSVISSTKVKLPKQKKTGTENNKETQNRAAPFRPAPTEKVLLLVKISKVAFAPNARHMNTSLSQYLIKVRFKGQASKWDVNEILLKRHKAVAFKVDNWATVQRNPLIIELHDKEHYNGKVPFASENIVVDDTEQVRHKNNLRGIAVSVRTQVKADENVKKNDNSKGKVVELSNEQSRDLMNVIDQPSIAPPPSEALPQCHAQQRITNNLSLSNNEQAIELSSLKKRARHEDDNSRFALPRPKRPRMHEPDEMVIEDDKVVDSDDRMVDDDNFVMPTDRQAVEGIDTFANNNTVTSAHFSFYKQAQPNNARQNKEDDTPSFNGFNNRMS